MVLFSGVDIWAVGCILAELLLRRPFVAGETDLDQLSKIFQAMGTPTEDNWPGHTKLPDFVVFKNFPPCPFRVRSDELQLSSFYRRNFIFFFQDIFIAAGPDLIAFLESLLATK